MALFTSIKTAVLALEHCIVMIITILLLLFIKSLNYISIYNIHIPNCKLVNYLRSNLEHDKQEAGD